MPAFSKIRTVLCDLDGVVWLAHQPIEGSVEAVERMRASGRRVLFVTNNSAATIAQHEAALEHVGISAVGDVVSSSMAASRLVGAGERVLVTGGPGVMEAVERSGATAILNRGGAVDAPIDAVVVGLHLDFDYQILAAASTAVRAGARLIGTNSDTTFPTPEGLAPGGGAILAAVEAASGVVAEVAGKPHRSMAALIGEILSLASQPFDPASILMVGDRPETDGLFAAEMQCSFVLVRTGVVAPGEAVDQAITIDADLPDLATLASELEQ